MSELRLLVSYRIDILVGMESWDINPNGTPGALRGRPLRYVLVQIMRDRRGALTITDLVAACEAAGVIFDGRASKIVSDALRWEVRRGRVRKFARGVYGFGHAPRSTLWRIRKHTGEWFRQLEALQRERWINSFKAAYPNSVLLQ